MSNLAKPQTGWEISKLLGQWRDEDQPAPQIDSTVQIVTAENISFNYEAAGPFRRLVAYLIDLALLFAFLVGLAILFFVLLFVTLLVLAALRVTGLTVQNVLEAVGLSLQGYYLMIIFISLWSYGILLESYWSGQTLGKWMLGLRAVSVDGHPITAVQAVLRNLFRGADAFPLLSPAILSGVIPSFFADYEWIDSTPTTLIPTFMVGLCAMMFNRRFQRVGDVISGTMVVIEERRWLMGVAKVDDPRTPQLAALIPPKFKVSRGLAQALAIYVERRRFFSVPRRREIARHLGEPLLRIFNMPPDTSHDLLLCALYYRTFVADAGSDDQEAWAAYMRQHPPSVGAAPPGHVVPPVPAVSPVAPIAEATPTDSTAGPSDSASDSAAVEPILYIRE